MNHIFVLHYASPVLVQVRGGRSLKEATERMEKWVKVHHEGIAFSYAGELKFIITAF